MQCLYVVIECDYLIQCDYLIRKIMREKYNIAFPIMFYVIHMVQYRVKNTKMADTHEK